MDRLNATHVRNAARVMVRRAVEAGVTEAEKWRIGKWSPGDGMTRYRVESDDGREPLGGAYWLGAREAYYGLQTAARCFELAAQARLAKKGGAA